MDKNIIEKYKAEMLDMYSKSKVRTVNANVISENIDTSENSSGGLIAIVSALREIYPVANAKITIFTGNYNDMQVIDTDLTDNSGRSKTFVLETPAKELSLNKKNTTIPYSSYNMMVSAEGYIDNIHLNIPVFSGVTSLQRSNMMLIETAGQDKGPQFFDESQRFDL